MVKVTHRHGEIEEYPEAYSYEVENGFMVLYGAWTDYEKEIGQGGIFPFNYTRYECGKRRTAIKTIRVSETVQEIAIA